LNAQELETRYAPAVLSFVAPVGNGPDVITVRLSGNGNKFEILDDGAVVASQNTNNTDSVVVSAAAGEGDSLVVDYSFGAFPQPVAFADGASGAAANVTNSGGSVALDFSTSTRAVAAVIGSNTTTATFVGGGGVSVVGVVSTVTGTSGADTFTDDTTIDLLTLDGGLGNDAYVLNPGSTIAITDGGGNDQLDFSTSNQAIAAAIGTTSTIVTDANGLVAFAGTVEGVTGTAMDDTFTDDTTIELLTLDGGLGDDTFRLDPGSTIAITDGGGNDQLDFSTSTQPITATVQTIAATVTDLDGLVTFAGTVEAVTGTSEADTFIDAGDVDFVFTGGAGSDTYDLQPGSSIHIVETGDDKDAVRLGRANFGVDANLATGVITDTDGNQVLVTGGLVENFDGTAFADVVVGNAADNVLFGGEGDDVFNGGAGNDLYILTPGGNDTITDPSGIDTLDFSRTTASGVNVDLSRTNGSAQNIATGATLALTGVIERVIGTQQADVLAGGGGDDVLVGLGGDDRLLGQSGNDLLLGGAGDDDLNGGSGTDILVGGAGADRLNAGSGQDILIAGYTLYDADTVDLTAWGAIQGVWVGSGTAAERVAAIRAGVGPTGQYRLRAAGDGQTVFDDGNPDVLTGGQSTDWYFAQVPGNDVVTDKDNQEFFNDLP
jgi:Ca2+-binding RTX toxin-like protein